MDKLVLKGLKFRANHGYFENERVEGNDFEVDLAFNLYLDKAAKNDNLEFTVDYAKARELVASVMEGEPVKLIETLTFRIGELLSQNFKKAERIQVSVRKLNPPMGSESRYSEVTMRWPR